MDESQHPAAEKLVKLGGIVGAGLFSLLALKMGADAWESHSTGRPMSDWKGGTMEYADGVEITAVFAVIALCAAYCALHARRLVNSWHRRKGGRRNEPG